MRQRLSLYIALALSVTVGAIVVMQLMDLRFFLIIAVGSAFVVAFAASLLRQRMKHGGLVLQIVVIVLIVVAFFLATTNHIVNGQLFPPTTNEAAYNTLKTNPKMEELSINDGALTGWFVHNVEGKAPLVIYFQGRGEDSSGDLEGYNMEGLVPTANLMTFDYPGMGHSAGPPSQKNYFTMATTVYDYALTRPDVDPTRIIILGYSLGTGVATYLASQRNEAGLVLVAPYLNAASLLNIEVPMFYGPMKLTITQRFNSDQYARDVHVAPLIISSTTDGFIPDTQAQALAAVFPQTAQVHIFTGPTHPTYFDDQTVRDTIAAYVQEVTA